MFTESYERKLKGNSLILTEEREIYDSNSFEERMITENQIRGFIPCTLRTNDGKAQFVYDITSKQSYQMLFEEKELKGNEIRKLISGIINVRNELSEYLLSDENLILDPKYLYADPETKTPLFVFYPYYNHELKESLLQLGMFILERTNHEDDDAVSLAYGFYKYVVNENYAFEKLLYKSGAQTELEYEDFTIENIYKENTHKEKPIETGIKNGELKTAEEIDMEGYQFSNSGTCESESIEKTILLICTSILIILIIVVIIIKYYRLDSLLFVSNRKLMGLICLLAAVAISAPLILLINKKGEKNRRLRYESISKEIAETENKKKKRLLSNTNSYGKTEEIIETDSVKHRLVCYEEDILEILIDKLPYTIGKSREDVDKSLDFRQISRIHAKIFDKSGDTYIMDCNSTNGTSVNGRILAANESVKLHENDEISLGGKVFYFR